MASQRDTLLGYYRQMMQIRRFEEEAARAYAQGKIGGFLHLYIGQEAVAVGVNAALEPGDYAFQTYRDHGIALARGMTSRAGMAELFGKDPGCSRGLGGSMHFFDVEHNFLGGWGIIGGHLALAAGTAFKSKYSGDGRVTVCFFGEGATNIGGFHEAMSLAGLWKLPAVFICENNHYAMGTPMSRTSALEDLSIKAQGYAMAGDHFEGHDVDVVRDRVKQAVDRARSGGGPTFIEIDTYRFRGHSISDPGNYRTKDEIEQWKKRDAVLIARDRLQAAIGEDELVSLEAHVKAMVQEAVRFSEQAPAADPADLWTSVYATAGTDPRRM